MSCILSIRVNAALGPSLTLKSNELENWGIILILENHYTGELWRRMSRRCSLIKNFALQTFHLVYGEHTNTHKFIQGQRLTVRQTKKS